MKERSDGAIQGATGPHPIPTIKPPGTLDASGKMSLKIPLEGKFSGTISVMLQDNRGILLLSHDGDVYDLNVGQAVEPSPMAYREDEPGGGPGRIQNPLPETSEPQSVIDEIPVDPRTKTRPEPEPLVPVDSDAEPRSEPVDPDADGEPGAAPGEPTNLLGMIMEWFQSRFMG